MHHEVEALRRIGRVKGLVGATGLQHAQGDDRHPLATRNEHRDHILCMKAFPMDISGDAVRNLIQYFVGKTLVLIDHRDIVRGLCHLITEHGNNGRVHIQFLVGLVETIQQGTLALGADVDVAQEGLA